MKDHDDLEQLLKAASGPKDTSKKTLSYPYTQAREFIAAKNIVAGNMPVPKALIYDYYTQWSKNPVSKGPFFSNFNKFIKSGFFEGNRVCYLDPTCFDLPNYYTFARDYRFNKANKRRPPDYIGVYEIAGYYIARLKTEENLHYLGRFKTAKEAALVHDEHARKHFGSDAKLNFPGVGTHEQRQEAQIRKTKISGSER